MRAGDKVIFTYKAMSPHIFSMERFNGKIGTIIQLPSYSPNCVLVRFTDDDAGLWEIHMSCLTPLPDVKYKYTLKRLR